MVVDEPPAGVVVAVDELPERLELPEVLADPVVEAVPDEVKDSEENVLD